MDGHIVKYFHWLLGLANRIILMQEVNKGLGNAGFCNFPGFGDNFYFVQLLLN